MNGGTGRWTEETVDGFPCHVYRPAHINEHGYAVIYLHGVHLQQLADYPAFVAELERHGLPAVCPVTGRCWWVDRPCPDFAAPWTPFRHITDHVLPWMAAQLQVAPPRIALLGTSMGGQGALQLAYRHPDMFPVCAAISPAIDFHRKVDEGDPILMAMYDDSERARQDTAILHIHPLNWPRHQFFCCDPADYRWHDGADRLRMKLNSLGVPFACDLDTTGGGHGIEYYGLMAPRVFDFILQRLDQERRRLPISKG